MKLYYWLIFIFLLGRMEGKCMSETGNFFFTALDVKDGLSQQTVTVIFQDRDGYLWFGTRNGLNCYDGYEFKVYRKNYDDTHSLSGNYIMSVVQDRKNDIWVGTQEGVNRIDYETEKINRYRLRSENKEDLYINAVYNTLDSKLLAFTKGNSYIYDSQSDTFRLWTIPEGKLPKNITSVTEDKQGNLYLGSFGDGLYVYDSAGRFLQKMVHQPGNESSLLSGYISFLSTDSTGRVWMIMEDKNVCCYVPGEKNIIRFPGLKNVRQVIDWNDKYLLAGTFQGLVLIDKITLQPEPVNMNIGTQGGLSHYSILSLYRDMQSNLWVGTYSGGVNYFNKYNYRFNYIPAKEFTGIIGKGDEDRNGNIWFATEGRGLLCYEPATNLQRSYLVHNREDANYNKNIIKSVLMEENTILCGTHGGEVYSFSISDRTFRLLYNFGYNDIYALYRDSCGRLWIPTNTKDGLVVMDGNQCLDGLNAKKQCAEIGVITSIVELSKNRFLLGTLQRGVFILELEGNFILQIMPVDFGFEQDNYLWVTDIKHAPDGDVWVATNGAGLFLFDSGMKLKKRYFRGNGLMDERIYSIMGNGDLLWLMASRELYRLNKQTGELNRFYSKDGIIPEEFSISAGLTGKDGKLYLSGAKGFLMVDPNVLNVNQEIPPVWLTKLSINNEVVAPAAKDSPLTHKLQLQDRLILKPKQTNITIGYAALNYIYSEQNQYAYRLVGLEDKWNYVGNRREAFYSNLKPGEYTFQVIASNNDGVWNEEGTELTIQVLWPLWMKWWAWLIYVAVVVYTIYRIVLARHRKHELVRSLKLKQLEQEKLEELAEERTRFFTHVTHEFRTPLTLIINPLDELLQKYIHIAGVKDSILLIRRNAQRLLSLVNSLMDIEKQQSGKVALTLSNFDFTAFMHEIGHSFLTVAESRAIHFTTEIEPDYLPVRCDREKLEQVFFNLLSNAFKFTPSQGEVRIRVNLLQQTDVPEIAGKRNLPVVADRWLCIRVEDNGIGIVPEVAEKIFEPFYQSGKDLHGQIAGSGIGLSLSKSIVEQHEGIIFAQPQETGTGMYVLIPYRYDAEMPVENNYVLDEEETAGVVNRKKPGNSNTLETAFRTDYKLLLAEDNAEVLEYLQKQLAAEYTIYTAVNGQEALEIAERELPDMIITDVMMPVMDGIELCTRIKKDIRLCHIPVILLTAKSMTMHIEEGYNAGADDYIPKPFSISLLKIRLRNIFASREQMKEIFSKKFSLESLGIEVESIDQTFMDHYVEVVKKNFTNTDLDVEMICRELGMSRANFYKKLKTITDLSPAEMIRNIRLESAARLLKETKLTISEVAVQVGFSSNSYFGSCFKALYGLSPKEFQNSKN